MYDLAVAMEWVHAYALAHLRATETGVRHRVRRMGTVWVVHSL